MVARRFLLAAGLVALAVPLGVTSPAHALAGDLFFSEYIEGSSNNKALEMFNGTGAPVDLTAGGYSVQMYFNGSATAGLTINLSGTVAAGDVLVLAQSSASPTILAQADQTNGSGWFNGDDAVVLRKGTTVLDVIGQTGLDPGTEWGSGLTSTADNTLRRKSSICAGDTNGGDAFDPSVEWDGFATDTFDGLGSHPDPCGGGGDSAPQVASSIPTNGAAGVARNANVAVTFSEPVTVSGTAFGLSCSASGTHAVVASGGPTTFTLDPSVDLAFAETCTLTVKADHVSDQDPIDPPDTMALDYVASFATEAAPTPIHDIQQASHRSSLAGTAVTTTGIVTAKASNGFYLQDPVADSDDATSEAIFVFTSSAPAVQVGDSLKVSGSVSEFRAGGAASTNLTTTELTGSSIVVQSSSNALPTPTVIGTGGRLPPTQMIEDDATGDVETSGVFDPASDGIDFYESLEAMRVQVNNPIAVGPTNAFGEIPVVVDGGANASVRTARGGVIIRPVDSNPERVFLDDTLVGSAGIPLVHVGDGFTTPAVGVLDYSFGNFKLNVTQPLTRVDNGLVREVTTAPAASELAVATFNVENLSPNDPQSKFDALANQIVNHLLSPDVVALEEIQDNNGATNDALVDADITLTQLVAAIAAAGGPAYDWRQINPVDDQDGGQPGGNIRVGLLFRTDRGIAFVDRPGGSPTTPTSVVNSPSGPQLSVSPGRIDPGSTAWDASRKPLVGEFTYRGETVFVIANHFNSKGGDDPLFGHLQPPTRISEVQRHQQAQVVNDFVDSILAVDGAADIVVLGDINDFDFSDTVSILKGGVLHNLMDVLPQDQRYSYVFEGNSQVLDQILVSSGLDIAQPAFDPVHINAEFFDQQSDHDPSVTLINFDHVWTFNGFLPPVDNGGVLNSVKAGQAVPVKFQLGGDRGLDILTPSSPASVQIACSSGAPVDPIEETATAGASGLHYDATTQIYTYVWKTQKGWTGTCRRFTLRLDDGTFRTADFQFK